MRRFLRSAGVVRSGANFRRMTFSRNRSGSAAVEFALIAPVFLMMVLGMLGFGIYLGAVHSVRQLTSDVARATISGATEEERQSIAMSFVEQNVASYAFIDLDHLEVTVRDSALVANQFDVEIAYDSVELPIWSLSGFFPAPARIITSNASIRNGGYDS